MIRVGRLFIGSYPSLFSTSRRFLSSFHQPPPPPQQWTLAHATMSDSQTVKLSNTFVPSAYVLDIKVDLSQWSYTAQETVRLKRSGTSGGAGDAGVVTLHAAPSIDITSVCGASLVGRDEVRHTVSLKLDNPADDAPSIQFAFAHGIQEELRGFYRVRFQHDGKEHRMASTHFEPVSARRFYICQDEPAARADFNLTVRLPEHEAHYTVLSGGPLRSKEVTGGEAVFAFDTVPQCPPYLTVCCIGELEYVETVVGEVPVRVYTSLGKKERAHFALKITAFALDYFARFFQHPFPLPKLDVVAVPDFPIGGMENWGCITCIESILVDEKRSSLAARKRASELLCHEVSHNWFGNLVAINWWEGLWLKEGFASYLGNHASHVYEPQWRCLEDAAQEVAGAKVFDTYEHSHPVEVPIRDPADITQIFDLISYDKGMGLVFMLEAFLGDKWGSAAAFYINKYRYSDTRTPQLWEALEESSGLPIAEVMNTFTTQMGYPLIHVSRPSPASLVLRQQPAKFASGDQTSAAEWCVPIVVEACGEGEGEAARGRHTLTLRGRDPVDVALPEPLAAAAAVTANPHRTGFHRCRYDDGLHARLVDAYARLHTADRCALISDTLACIQMGFTDDVQRLAVLCGVVRQHEEKRAPLRELVSVVTTLASAFADAEVSRRLRVSCLGFLIGRAEAEAALGAGADASSPEYALRSAFYLNTALGLLATAVPLEEAQRSPLFAWAAAQAEAFLAGGDDYSAATLARSLALHARTATGAATARERADALAAQVKVHDGNDEVCRSVLTAVCMSPETAVVKRLARDCVEGTVRPHYGGTIFVAAADNPSFAEGELWEFFRDNFAGIDAQWGGGQFRIQVIVSAVLKTLSGEARAQEAEAFFETHPLPNAKLAIGRAIEDIRLRVWLNENVVMPS